MIELIELIDLTDLTDLIVAERLSRGASYFPSVFIRESISAAC